MNRCFHFKRIVFLLILHIQQSRIKAIPPPPPEGTDCTEIIAENPYATSGTYMIQPFNAPHPFRAFCENRADGGWTVIQRRNGKGADGNPVDFYKPWTDYQGGFGDVRYEHWLGLDYMHELTNQPGKKCELRVDMINCQNQKGYALYDRFRIASEAARYSLHLGSYRGNTGDAFRGNQYSGTQDGRPFSTHNNDNDDCHPCFIGDIAFNSCAENQHSAGWFSNCGLVDLNGIWHNQTDCEGWSSAVYWETWSSFHSLLFTELKVKCY
ncbi:angiopoietin-related protein 5-like [Sceloporus undulatus]|uniref:angiopoietin-related protein 5-like n=1 Tax=Sceloporus undulatus TaxID=8520 RepID=UPI001C4B7D56|nr:angiopoietin-related protein 5-like [Sceloporus undulatus]